MASLSKSSSAVMKSTRPEEKSPPKKVRTKKGPHYIGPYQVGNEIGRGYFGVVHKALDIQTGDFVAIKTMDLSKCDEKRVAVVEREVQLLRKLEHDFIVRYINFVREGTKLHIVLEYVENGSLHDIIKKFGVFPESLVQIYTRQVLEGLFYLHSQGIVHRDIKGSNILITKGGQVKLADFGTSTFLEESDKRMSIVGTPYWMAPEVISQQAISMASDIWSLGCTVTELLTGYPPWGELDPMAALFRISQGATPPIPNDVTDACKGFLARCFVPKPDSRATAKELLSSAFMNQDYKPFHETLNRVKTINDLKQALEKHNQRISGGPLIYMEKRPPVTKLRRITPKVTPNVDADRDQRFHQLKEELLTRHQKEAEAAEGQKEEEEGHQKKAESDLLSMAIELLSITETFKSSLERAYEQTLRAQAETRDAVEDRQKVLQKLKVVQNQFRSEDRMDMVNQQRKTMIQQTKMYRKLELQLPSDVLASTVFRTLSYEQLRERTPDKVGWLRKQSVKSSGAGVRKSHWQDRLFLLKHNFLFYYKNEKDHEPQGILHLDRFEVSQQQAEKDAFRAPKAVGSPMVTRANDRSDHKGDEKEHKIDQTIAEWYGESPKAESSHLHRRKNKTAQCIRLSREGLSYNLVPESEEELFSWLEALSSPVSWTTDEMLLRNSNF